MVAPGSAHESTIENGSLKNPRVTLAVGLVPEATSALVPFAAFGVGVAKYRIAPPVCGP